MCVGGRGRFSNVNPQGRKETAGQIQKNEGTGKIERTEDFLFFDMCRKETMLNERGKKVDHRT
jgi:hypothetical protein